ncbi:MAG: hypothetical protein DRO05_00920 [Thermoproteota archaeon]|nr:MAG: hypothetical protein DRO05_00920 [Candidatus Korarchaeota archaeon]
MIGTIKKKLQDQREKLLKYCHDEKCSNIYTCPWEHEKCEKKLGLDTAIAWVAGYVVFQILYKAFLDDLKDHFHTLCYLYEVVRLHKDQYPVLFQLLHDTVYLVDDLVNIEIMESMKKR